MGVGQEMSNSMFEKDTQQLPIITATTKLIRLFFSSLQKAQSKREQSREEEKSHSIPGSETLTDETGDNPSDV